MAEKTLPFTKEQISKIILDFPTPFHIYDEKGLRENARAFKKAFSILPGFKEYFAVKSLPNPYILHILKEEGFGADCSSGPEIVLAEKAGITKEDIMFTSNNTSGKEFIQAKKAGAVINLDDFSHIDYLEKEAGLPELVCFRYNPGPAREGNTIIGDPKEAKYGFTKEQLLKGYALLKEKGVKRFGIHTMIASNELHESYFVETAKMLFELVLDIEKQVGISIEFVNLGGGIGVAYKPEEKVVDYTVIAEGVKELYDSMNMKVKVYLECGRVISGPYGYLLGTVQHLKHIYKDYVGLDATMANLMRPGMYGSYHHITVLGKENSPHDHTYDVTGSLCENNDKFAVDRTLPKIEVGDILAIHDTGAHGHSMGFNYNAKLRSAELLLREDGSVLEIRRAETEKDYFATLDFDTFKKWSTQ